MIPTYVAAVACFAAIGTLLYGYDTGIATTTIAHSSWVTYMGHPNAGLTGAVTSVYIGAEAIGTIMQILLADRLGRLRFIQLLCIIVTIGSIIQTAAVSFGMFLAGRAIAGLAVGAMVSTVPVYLTEISPPAYRGLVTGLTGLGICFGTMLANWIGFACGYAPDGPVQWRLPLALQLPWGVILFLGAQFILPESPRWLIQHGHDERARKSFSKVHRGIQDADQEFEIMQSQILFEESRDAISWKEAFTKYRHRALITIACQASTALTGVNVIGYYQTISYQALGISGHTILALTGVYATIAMISNIITSLWVVDRWGRRGMLLAGYSAVVLVEIYAAVMQREFQTGTNRVGQGFAILGIYLYVALYYGLVNSTVYVYGSEVLPVQIRSKVTAVALCIHFVVNVAITEAGPTALANIHENYYYVFVSCTFFFLVNAYFFFPETKGMELEEIAGIFKDRVVDLPTEKAKTEMLEDTEGSTGTAA